MNNNKIDYLPQRCIVLLIGLTLMALGVAFSIRADLGTSPISSLPYVTGLMFDLSVGTTTVIINTLFVLIQILILRREYQWLQLLQIGVAAFFGMMIDLWGAALDWLNYSNYLQQWVLCVIGIVVLALGVSVEVMANLLVAPGEGIVLAVCKKFPIKFGNAKVGLDVTLVLLAVLLSLLCLGGLKGVREGTIAAAICVGLITKIFNKPLDKLKAKIFA